MTERSVPACHSGSFPLGYVIDVFATVVLTIDNVAVAITAEHVPLAKVSVSSARLPITEVLMTTPVKLSGCP